MIPRLTVAAAVILLAACGITEPVAAHESHAVLVSVQLPGPCLVGGCDPASPDATALALITIRNTGSGVAYLEACGASPAFEEQERRGSEWVNVGPADACVFPSDPIALAAGDSLQLNSFFGPGLWRLELPVATTPTLSDAEVATSASFDVF